MADGSIIQKSVAAPGFQLSVPAANTGLQDAGSAIADFGQALAKARDQSQLVDARLKYSQQVDDLYLQYKDDADPATATARFQKAAQDAAAPLYDGLSSDDARATFSLDAGQLAESRRISMADLSFKRESDAAIANVDAAGEKFAKDAAYATNPAERQAAIDNYSQSVMGVADAGMMTHESAAAKVSKFQENLSLYDGRAQIDKDPEQAVKLLADPNYLPDLDPLHRVELNSAAEAQVRQNEREARADAAAARSEQNQQRAEARTNAALSIADLDTTVGSGLPVAQAVVDQAIADVRASGDARLANHLSSSLRSAYFATSLRGLRPVEVEHQLAQAYDAAAKDGANPSLAAAVTGGRKFLDTMNRQLGQDPLGWANQQGVVQIQPLELNGQDSAQAWGMRIRAGNAAAQHYGIQPRYLTAAEGDQVKTQLSNSADPTVRMATLRMLTSGLGSRVVPELARLGISPSLIVAGGLLSAGPAHARTAFDVVNGETALAATSKGGDGQSALRPTDPARALSLGGAGRLLGGVTLPQGMPQVMQATVMLPGEAARISDAADAIYAARAPGRGLTGKDASGAGKDLYQQALQEAAGARYEGETQMGGLASYRGRPVLVPATIAAAAFEGVVNHLTAADLAHASQSGAPPVDASGKPLADNFLRKAYLVTAGDGLYALSTTDPSAGAVTPVRDTKGAIYRLNFHTALTALQARSAGAAR